jgi:hypothetical protein
MRDICENGRDAATRTKALANIDVFVDAPIRGYQRPTALDIEATLMTMVAHSSYIPPTTQTGYYVDRIHDIDAISLVHFWGKNKQVFQFDKDFLDVLSDTETIKFVKDLYDHLPFKYFYMDFSANQEICKQIQGEGVFVHLNKWGKEISGRWCDMYDIHLCKVIGDMFYSDCLSVSNNDFETKMENELFKTPWSDIKDSGTVDIDRGLYRRLIFQCLTYLCSDLTDVRENPNTEKTYKPPKAGAKPKHKYSEVRKQDVGVRFGTSFRRWRTEHQKQDGEVHYTGRKNRPHYRRAHWHTYRYGVGRTEKKVVWQHECAINMDLGTETDSVVVHKTRGEER